MNDKDSEKGTQDEYRPIPLAKPLNGRTTNCVMGGGPWLQAQLERIGYRALVDLSDLELGLSRHPHALVQIEGVYRRLDLNPDGSVSLGYAPPLDLMNPPPMFEAIKPKD